MKPLNRRLLIEVIEEEAQEGSFFVPTQEQQAEFQAAKVLACSEDCARNLTGQTIVFHSYGMEDVVVKGKKYLFIGENHLICVE